MSEWISVKDRLPQECGAICINVILLMDDGTVTAGWLNQITNKGYYLDTLADVIIKAPLSRFTHWLPLPEPPARQKDEPMTNADRIRHMNDDELAEFFDKVQDFPCKACCNNMDKCRRNNAFEPVCKRHYLDWLQESAGR